jgi:hypothetical protein
MNDDDNDDVCFNIWPREGISSNPSIFIFHWVVIILYLIVLV